MERNVSELLGKTLLSVEVNEDNTEIVLTCQDGEKYVMFHDQDCCESVYVEDICGDIGIIIGSPILIAEETTNNENPKEVQREYQDDSFTWTFYKFATVKGYVTIRWYAESNGYYSESVDFKRVSERRIW